MISDWIFLSSSLSFIRWFEIKIIWIDISHILSIDYELLLHWKFIFYENLSDKLGKHPPSKTDEFLEKFQTAFDPPPSFSENHVADFL